MVSYAFETLSPILLERSRQRMFENRVLRRVLGLKSAEETKGWRELRKEKLCNLYPSPSEGK
jgi:hypothetical protein